MAEGSRAESDRQEIQLSPGCKIQGALPYSEELGHGSWLIR